MPKNRPTVADKPTPMMTDVQGSAMGTEVRLRTANATIHARTTPASPPTAESTDDSTRYWYRMSRRRAPSDLRMPISCVRSVTTANMMFMMTRSEEHTSELQSLRHLVCRLLLEKKKKKITINTHTPQKHIHERILYHNNFS